MPYHHGNLREALIDAGVELAAKDGPDAVALREVARRVGVSHNAAYRHFEDRDALLSEVAARAMSGLGRLMAERIDAAATGRSKVAAAARLQAAGRAYVEFATSEPGLFRMAFAHTNGSIDIDDGVDHPYEQLRQRLDELVTTKSISRARRKNAEIAAWSAVHGYATLLLDGPLQDASAADREDGLEVVLRIVRRGV